MTALWKNIKGIRRVVLETLVVFISALIVYLAVYLISGKVEIAVFAVFAVATAVAAFATVAFATVFAVVAAFATTAAAAFATVAFAAVAVAAAFATVAAAAAFATVVAEKYEVKYWKVLIVYVIEGLALFGAMKFAVPYSAIGILAVLFLGIVFLFAESKMRLWLSANAPTAPAFDEEREEIGSGAYRASDVIMALRPSPEPLRLRLHRRLHNLYIN